MQRFLDAYDAAAPVSLLTLWAPLELVEQREGARDGRRRLGDRVETCCRSMQANLDGLGHVLVNLDAPELIAETLDELSLAGGGLCLAARIRA